MELLKAIEFFDLSQDLFCVIGTDGYLKRVNKAFRQAVGFIDEAMLSEPLSHFLHPDDLSSFIKFYKEYTMSSKTYEILNRFRCADGSYKWFSWNCTKAADQPYIYASVRDCTGQKRLERKLKLALKANQALLNSSLDVICSIDINGYFRSVSKASCNLWGYSPEEVVGKHCSEILHPEDGEITKKMASDLLQGIEMTNFENRYIHKNGNIVPIIWSAKWSEENGLFYCIARNATERKQQEQQIIFNERRFRGLVQTGADLIGILNEEGIYQYISPTVSTIIGYDPEFLIGKNPIDFIHPEDKDVVKTFLFTVFQQYRVELPVFRFLNADGEWCWMKTVITNRLNDASINGIVINSRNVTQQLAIEEQKEKAIKKLNNLIENYTQGYFSLDKDWVIRAVNPATLKLLGLTREQLIGKAISELFPRSSDTSFYEQYQRAIKEDTFVEFEERMSRSNRWFQISAYPYEDTLTVFFKENTAEKLQQLLVNLEKDVLEMNTRSDSSLKETVDHYLKGLTDIYKIKCFLSLYKKEKALLYPFSAPTFPEEYFEALANGFEIGPEDGSCGAAAYFKESFIIRDIAMHTNSRQFKDLLLKHELQSCWSIPLLNKKDRLIGTLAIYHDSVKVPDEDERELVKRVEIFLLLLIESYQTKERLVISNERHKYINYATNDAIYDWNIVSGQRYWGEGAAKLFGHNGQLHTSIDWENRIHPSEKKRIVNTLETVLADTNRSYFHEEYRYRRADKSYAFVIEDGYIIRDPNLKPIRMIGALKDVSKLKENAYQIMTQNKRLQEIATINSHHIRKPLANILGLIEAIKFSDEDCFDELFLMLEESGNELDKIVRKIAKKTLV